MIYLSYFIYIIFFVLSFIVIIVYFQVYSLCDCAWSVGDLHVRAYLQDEVVSRVPCHRKGMCVRVLGRQLFLYIHSLEYHMFNKFYSLLLLAYAPDT